MSDIGRIIEEGEAPHSADYISLWLSSTNLGYIIEDEGNECELTVSGNDVTIKAGEVYFGDTKETRSFSEETITISASAESGHRYDLLAIRKDNGGTELVHKQGTRTEYNPEVGEIPTHPDISHPATTLEIPIAVVYFEPNDSNITILKDSRSVQYKSAEDPHDNNQHDGTYAQLTLRKDQSLSISGGSSETIVLDTTKRVFVTIGANQWIDPALDCSFYYEVADIDGIAQKVIIHNSGTDTGTAYVSVFTVEEAIE